MPDLRNLKVALTNHDCQYIDGPIYQNRTFKATNGNYYTVPNYTASNWGGRSASLPSLKLTFTEKQWSYQQGSEIISTTVLYLEQSMYLHNNQRQYYISNKEQTTLLWFDGSKWVFGVPNYCNLDPTINDTFTVPGLWLAQWHSSGIWNQLRTEPTSIDISVTSSIGSYQGIWYNEGASPIGEYSLSHPTEIVKVYWTPSEEDPEVLWAIYYPTTVKIEYLTSDDVFDPEITYAPPLSNIFKSDNGRLYDTYNLVGGTSIVNYNYGTVSYKFTDVDYVERIAKNIITTDNDYLENSTLNGARTDDALTEYFISGVDKSIKQSQDTNFGWFSVSNILPDEDFTSVIFKWGSIDPDTSEVTYLTEGAPNDVYQITLQYNGYQEVSSLEQQVMFNDVPMPNKSDTNGNELIYSSTFRPTLSNLDLTDMRCWTYLHEQILKVYLMTHPGNNVLYDGWLDLYNSQDRETDCEGNKRVWGNGPMVDAIEAFKVIFRQTYHVEPDGTNTINDSSIIKDLTYSNTDANISFNAFDIERSQTAYDHFKDVDVFKYSNVSNVNNPDNTLLYFRMIQYLDDLETYRYKDAESFGQLLNYTYRYSGQTVPSVIAFSATGSGTGTSKNLALADALAGSEGLEPGYGSTSDLECTVSIGRSQDGDDYVVQFGTKYAYIVTPDYAKLFKIADNSRDRHNYLMMSTFSDPEQVLYFDTFYPFHVTQNEFFDISVDVYEQPTNQGYTSFSYPPNSDGSFILTSPTALPTDRFSTISPGTSVTIESTFKDIKINGYQWEYYRPMFQFFNTKLRNTFPVFK